MKSVHLLFLTFVGGLCGIMPLQAQYFKLNTASGYFQNKGVDVMAFDDIYPEGHQSGVSIIMHGNRVATNGDIRFEPTPGNGNLYLLNTHAGWMLRQIESQRN